MCSGRPADRRWRWSTTATSTPATTLSIPEHKLGNVMEADLKTMAESGQQTAFGNAKSDSLPRMCRQCDVRFACNGECPKHRFARTPDGEFGLNYLCAGYKHFFHHIDPYMQFMAGELRAGRAPANIMRIVGSSEIQMRFERVRSMTRLPNAGWRAGQAEVDLRTATR